MRHNRLARALLSASLGIAACAGLARAQPATGPASTVPTAPTAVWDAFADALRQQGSRVMAAVPERLRNDPHIQQEVNRLLLGAVTARAIDAIGADGDHPAFLPWANVYLSPHQPNDDTTYRKAVITPGGTYRLRGTIGSLRIVKLFQLSAPIEETGVIANGMGVLGSWDFSQLHANRTGHFDLVISPERPPGHTGDWWKLDPRATTLWLRQVAYDWGSERDPALSIERLDVPVTRPRQSADDLAARLGRLATLIGNTAIYMVDHVEQLRNDGVINRLRVWQTPSGKSLQQLAGFNSQFYYEGAFDIGPDEALIIEAKVPDQCHYWSLLLTNDIYESIDWYNNQTSLNGAQARVDKDGRVRVVVSSRDPGVPNWLDPAGHLTGAIQGRWTDCSETPIPTVSKVAFGDVRKLLPADTPDVSPAQREQIIRDRRSHAQQRPLW